MKILMQVYTIGILVLCAQNAHGQTFTPTINWEVETAMPADATSFMDYTDDFGIAGSSSPTESFAFLIDNNGVVTYPAATEDVEWVEPVNVVHNTGEHTYFGSSNTAANTISIRVMDNNALTFVYHTITFATIYSWVETVWLNVVSDGTTDNIIMLLRGFNGATNRWTVMVQKLDFNTLTSNFAEYEEIAFTVLGKNSYPRTALTNASDDLYIWGAFDKNVPGTNKDLFLVRMSGGGDIIFTKTYASYAGKNDKPIALEIDDMGNMYGVSQSADAIEPSAEHISVMKINPNNGKRQWIKRIGTGSEGSDIIMAAKGNMSGNGILLGGSVPDGSGGSNARVWSLNSAGAAVFTKTISFGPAGTIEQCNAIAFDPVSGDCILAGVTGTHMFMAKAESTTGAYVWSPGTINVNGTALNEKMQIDVNAFNVVIVSSLRDVSGVRTLGLLSIDATAERNSNIEINDDDISLYPMPVSTILNVTVTNEITGTVVITDLLGKVVYTTNITSQTLSIPVDDLQAGIYLLNISDGTTMVTKQFVKID